MMKRLRWTSPAVGWFLFVLCASCLVTLARVYENGSPQGGAATSTATVTNEHDPVALPVAQSATSGVKKLQGVTNEFKGTLNVATTDVDTLKAFVWGGGTPPLGPGDGHESRIFDAENTISSQGSKITSATGTLASVTGELAVVTGQLAEVTGTLAIVTGQYSIVTAQYAVVTGQLAAVTGQVAAVTQQIAVVTGQVGVVEREITILTGQVASVTQDLSVVTGRVAVITQQLAVVTGQLSTATQDLAVVTGKVGVIEVQITTVTGQVSVVTGQVAVITQQLAVVTGQLANVTQDLASATSRIGVAELKIVTVTGTVAIVTQDLAVATQQLAEVTGTLAVVTQDLAVATGQIGVVQRQLYVVTGQVASVTQDLAVVTGQVGAVLIQITTITQQVSAVTGQVAIATGQLAVVTGTLAVVTQDLAVATGQIGVIDGKLTTVTDQVAVATQTLATVTQQLAEVTGTLAVVTQDLAVVTSQLANATQDIGRIEAGTGTVVWSANQLVNAPAGGASPVVTGRLEGAESALRGMTTKVNDITGDLPSLTNRVLGLEASSRSGSNRFGKVEGFTNDAHTAYGWGDWGDETNKFVPTNRVVKTTTTSNDTQVFTTKAVKDLLATKGAGTDSGSLHTNGDNRMMAPLNANEKPITNADMIYGKISGGNGDSLSVQNGWLNDENGTHVMDWDLQWLISGADNLKSIDWSLRTAYDGTGTNEIFTWQGPDLEAKRDIDLNGNSIKGIATNSLTFSNGQKISAQEYSDTTNKAEQAYGWGTHAKTYPCFKLDLGGSWIDFEIKGSTNNFTTLVYYYVSSAANSSDCTGDGTYQTADDDYPFTFFADDHATTPGTRPVCRWRRATAHSAILGQISNVATEVEWVYFYPSRQCEYPASRWMSEDNTNLVWSYVRCNGALYETNASGTATHWNMIEPTWKKQRKNP